MIFSLLAGFVLGVAAIIFAFQNTAVVTLSFLGWSFESSLALLIAGAMLFGILLSALIAIPGSIQNSLKVRGLTKQNKSLLSEAEESKRSNNIAQAEINVLKSPESQDTHDL